MAMPSLPEDIWRVIIRFVVRKPGVEALDLPSPFSDSSLEDEEFTTPATDPSLITDRKSLRLVSRSWKITVDEAVAEHININEVSGLRKAIEHLERIEGELHLGTRTRFLKLNNFNTLPVEDVERLIGLTPNLVTCVFHDSRLPPGVQRVHNMPHPILKALMLRAGSLKRLEFKGTVTPPRFTNLAKLCTSLPRLTTLRLHAVYTYPPPPSNSEPNNGCDRYGNPVAELGYMTLPNLKTLSLTPILHSLRRTDTFAVIWDPFLLYLSQCSSQLPSLEKFESDIFPLNSLNFFRIHGHKIVHFRTAIWTVGGLLVQALKFCPNLRELVLVQGPPVVTSQLTSSQPYPALKRVCIRPHVESYLEVPADLYRGLILSPLDSVLEDVLSMDAPALEEVRIWDMGSLFGIFGQDDWVREWADKFRSRGVVLCDNAGRQYG